MSKKICSNHFAAGSCSSECRTPTLYWKGYDVDYKHNRQSLKTKQLDDCQGVSKPKRVRQICKVETDDKNLNICVPPPGSKEHDYEVHMEEGCTSVLPLIDWKLQQKKHCYF